MVTRRKYSPASTLWIACILAVAGSALLAERAASQQPKQLLFLTHAGYYKHTSLGPAETAVTSWGARAGFEVTSLQGYQQDAESLDLSIISASDGTIEGSSFTFTVTRSFGGNDFSQMYSGTYEGDTIEGTIEGGRGGGRPFTGTRTE